MAALPMNADAPGAAVEPGIYPGAGSATGLRYWNGTDWDPRPVARTWTRVWCNVIDNVLASIVWFILAFILLIPFVLLDPTGDNPLGGGISFLGLVLGFIGYFAVSYRLWGRTPGMMLGRLYVVHIPTGQSKLSWGTAIGRAAGLILGYICGIFTLIWLIVTASSRTKQGPHDSWARTGVLVEPPSRPDTTYLVSGSAASIATTSGPVPTVAPASPAADALPPTSGPSQPAPRPGIDTASRSSQGAAPGDTDATPQPQAMPGMATVAAPTATSQHGPGPEGQRRRSRAPLWIGLAVTTAVVLIAVVVAGIYVDSRMRANTLEQLLAAVEETESVIDDYNTDERFFQLSDDLRKAQGLQYQDDAFKQEAWRIFIDGNVATANEYVSPMQRAILDVEAVDPLPWHSDVAEAQEAYLDYANTWMDAVMRRTQHTTSDREVLDAMEGLNAQLSSTWTIAQRRFQDISIRWMPRQLMNDIDRIF